MDKLKELQGKFGDIQKGIVDLQNEALRVENEIIRLYATKVEKTDEEACNCENCACSEECDGEVYDDMVTIAETETDCLGIVVSEDEYGERYVLLQDTVDGDRVELNEKELNVIVAMMGL